MKKLTQTRLHNPPKSLGNCLPTILACLLDKDSPEDVLQIQEYYEDEGGWYHLLIDYLEKEGYELKSIDGHLSNDDYYLVSGNTVRGTYHIVIYKKGKLYHDPHPSRVGLIAEKQFEKLIRI